MTVYPPTVSLFFDRPEFANGSASVWPVVGGSAQSKTVRLDEWGQGYVPVEPGAAHDVVLHSGEQPPEAARVQMSKTDADFDEVRRVGPTVPAGQPRGDEDALIPGGAAAICAELRLIRKTIAAHGLATAEHIGGGTLSGATRVLTRMVQDNPMARAEPEESD